MPRLAAIGLGGRAFGVVNLMRQLDPELQLAAVADPDPEQIRTRGKAQQFPLEETRFFPNVDALLDAGGKYDGLIIGTRCFMHTPMAVRVAALKLPLYLEKPVAIHPEQVAQLAQAYAGREDQVVVSFPLRNTPLFLAMLEVVKSGRLGVINQVQAVNNVPYGGVYFGFWYRNYDQVGGLWLQKATHDFDYINLLAGSPPKAVAATTTQRIFGGDKPHDLKCSACDEKETCPESPKAHKARGDCGGMPADDHFCAFSREIRNEDAGSALILYENGVHASYSQNFVSRRSAGSRGARVIGYLGTAEFDWFTDTLKVIDHHNNRVDRIEVKASSGHMGGDHVLAQNFLELMRGKGTSQSDLKAGLLSASMCLSARLSSQTQTFQQITLPDAVRQSCATAGAAAR